MKDVPFDELLSAYLDGELSETDRLDVERQLERSAEARRLLEELRAVSRLVAGLPGRRLDEQFAPRVVEQIERGQTVPLRRPGAPRVARWAAAAAALAAAIAGVWLMLLDRPADRGTRVTLAEPRSANRPSQAPEGERLDERPLGQSADRRSVGADEAREPAATEADGSQPPFEAGDEALAQNVIVVEIPQDGPAAVSLLDLRNSELGNTIEGIQDDGIVELVVVDRQEGVETFSVLLEANGVPLVADVPMPDLSAVVANTGDFSADTVEALCVEATPAQFNSALAQFADEQRVLAANYQAMSVDFVAQTAPAAETEQDPSGQSGASPAELERFAQNQAYLVQVPEPRGEPGQRRVQVLENRAPPEVQRELAGQLSRSNVRQQGRGRGSMDPLRVIVIVRDAAARGS